MAATKATIVAIIRTTNAATAMKVSTAPSTKNTGNASTARSSEIIWLSMSRAPEPIRASSRFGQFFYYIKLCINYRNYY